jgi:hypothetical protein
MSARASERNKEKSREGRESSKGRTSEKQSYVDAADQSLLPPRSLSSVLCTLVLLERLERLAAAQQSLDVVGHEGEGGVAVGANLHTNR